MELVCDEAAARATGEPLDVAAALVKVSRRIRPAALSPALRTSVSSFVPDGRSVERRVRHLISQGETVRRTPSDNGRVPGTTILISASFVVSLLGLTAWAPLAVHAAIESLFQFLR